MPVSDNNIVQFNVTSTEEVTVARKSKYYSPNRPSFIGIGISDFNSPIELFHKIDALNAAGRKAWLLTIENYDKFTNVLTLPKEEDPTQYTYRAKGMRELVNIGLLKKVPTARVIGEDGKVMRFPKSTYMISPFVLVPPIDGHRFDGLIRIWNQL